MLKLNKTTHIMIITSVAVLLIAFYLYHTINDLKRLNVEVKKLSTDLQNAVGTMSKEINDLKAKDVISFPVVSQVQRESIESRDPQVPQVEATEIKEQDDDTSSVNTDELKKIINEGEDAKSDAQSEIEGVEGFVNGNEEVEGVTETEVTEQQPSELFIKEALDKKKLPELKELCRQKNLDTKGTKEQLISRLMA